MTQAPPLPEGRFVTLPKRGRTWVRDTGGAGPVVLLLHGWTANADLNWFPCFSPLARAGYLPLVTENIALTYDDGPHPVWTSLILAALEQHGARATFFVQARRAAEHPELIEAIAAGGHEVGFHCLNHVRHSQRGSDEMAADLRIGLEMLDRLGVRPRAWRAPWGVETEVTRRLAVEHGLRLWGWNVDTHDWRGDDAVQIMTLHSAKGLEFPLVFLPGWEEGVFPSQRSMDEKGDKGLEEERRLAYVGITRAKEEARLSFVANRQVYGRWTSQLPSRFIDELPLDHVVAGSETGYYGGGPGMHPSASRWDEQSSFGSGYSSPGWQRAQSRKGAGGFDVAGKPRGGFSENGQPKYVPDGVFDDVDESSAADSSHLSPGGRGRAAGAGEGARARAPARTSKPLTIEGELVAKSTGATSSFTVGERVFHLKFGNGNVTAVEGNKLTIRFDKAGEKRVVDSFVERV